MVEKFNVDVTLRPQIPYIHVNPNFHFLYNRDFDDVRGLVCGGEFSIGMLDSAWNEYQIQNKNFQNIFDRQIQNLDRNNAIITQEALYTNTFGAVTGGARGAAAGSAGGV